MIEIKSLEKKFKNELVIKYKDYKFEDNKKYILLGASGCGKSTLLNMISGIISPTNGQIFIDDKEITAISQHEKDKFRIKNIGYIFQDFKLIEEMSVMDNIEVLRIEGIDTSNAINLLKTLSMYDKRNKKIKELSGGEKQRVAIVRALVKKPNIILADEPTGNLNFSIGETVIKELAEVSEGKTLIVVSHDERLTKYFDVVIDMNDMTSSYEEDTQNA
mgnify:CR=1 FL=1